MKSFRGILFGVFAVEVFRLVRHCEQPDLTLAHLLKGLQINERVLGGARAVECNEDLVASHRRSPSALARRDHPLSSD